MKTSMSPANDLQTLTNISTLFREALDHVTNGFLTGSFSKFPKDCSTDACALLQFYLFDVHSIRSEYRIGKIQISSRSKEISHCYLFIDGYIIDITADQFNKDYFTKVIVCETDEYPLTPYFKYVKNKSNEFMFPLNNYLECIYKRILVFLQNKDKRHNF